MSTTSPSSPRLRIIGDVHAQIDEFLWGRKCSYLDLIADCPYSVQLGDMGDGEAYDILTERVDPEYHCFFPGNHDHYHCLPAHSLGDYGEVTSGGVRFFFVRGARSTDKATLIRRGKEIGRQLYFEDEELTDAQMAGAREEYVRARPLIVITHDGPTRFARFAFENASRYRVGTPRVEFQPSRTSEFLEQLLDIHRPRLWLFGHHHHDWRYTEDGTTFVCVGELSFVDIDAEGNLMSG